MWRFDVRAGELWEGDQYSTHAYSGHDEHKNVPEDEAIKHLGPLPRGFYDIGPLFDSAVTGPAARRLTPQEGTDTFGRGDFEIHGDSIKAPGTASHGCLIVPRSIRERMEGTLEVFSS